jgi:hypothetical protein
MIWYENGCTLIPSKGIISNINKDLHNYNHEQGIENPQRKKYSFQNPSDTNQPYPNSNRLLKIPKKASIRTRI